MIPAETLLSFFTVALLLGVAPGPDNIFVLTQSALRGRTAGLIVTLGLCTGLLVHTAAVALGVAAIFQASSTAFTLLKLSGAAYLMYLAWQAFRAKASKIAPGKASALDGWQCYRRGIVMNVTNPKVSIFFLAFLPQFADPRLGALPLQIGMLGAVFMLATLLVFGSVALLAGSLGKWLEGSERTQIIMNRVAGTVFIALAAKLVMTER
ncbi:MAG: LysE family translocator [Undibacterium sp.]|uniref:LysE family translocator n=1 Tax=Undibacterium sp. TaxID=1914977 RepID=UPI002721723E|nr:LysE family translocator [Undibacterium sp.]MDO8650811.1 LysE family translocator [Undibacterium sp.]